MNTDSPSPHALVSRKIAEIESDIAKIFADAERRVAPLKLQLQRYKIADEVWRDIAPAEFGVSGDLRIVPDAPVQNAGKRSIRTMILDELGQSDLPLSKSEIMDRFVAAGESPVESTVGSTLSNMVKAGFLMKDTKNRYAIKPTETIALVRRRLSTQGNKEEEAAS